MTMKNLKRDPALATLPAPISLTQEQLAAVAADTGALLGAGGGLYVIYGGLRPISYVVSTPALNAVATATSVAAY
jgi:hypothetical protein